MKKLNKLLTAILSIAMVVLFSFPASATSPDVIYYTVYNEKGDVMKEGVIQQNSNTKYSWDDSITLDNGWYTSFMQEGPKAFYVTKDTGMKFSYTLDRRLHTHSHQPKRTKYCQNRFEGYFYLTGNCFF